MSHNLRVLLASLAGAGRIPRSRAMPGWFRSLGGRLSGLCIAILIFSASGIDLAQALNLGILPPGKSVTVKYQVTIASPTATQISNQATVTGSNFGSVLTDDPNTGTAGDPTITLVAIPPAVATDPTSKTTDVGISVSFTAAATGNPAPTVQWFVHTSADGAGVFNPVSGATATTLTIASPVIGQNGNIYHAVFTNIANTATTANATLTVNPALTIAPAALAAATAGTATNQTITVSNGTKPYTTFSISGFSAGSTGLTAANLTTDATAGTVVLSGTPTAAGTASFTVNVTDTPGGTLTKSYSLTVNPALSITPSALAGATAGRPTNQTITVSNGTTPYTTLSVTGFSGGTTGLTSANATANPGAGTVVLSGTPSAAGTASFTVNVTDTAGATLSKAYSLTVNPAPSIAPAALATAFAGVATNQTITVSDGTKPYTTFSISGFSAGGTGLTVANLTTDASAGTVVLSGTPTAAGTASFTVNVTDTPGATLSKAYSLTVNPGLSITPAALADATAGAPTSQTITVSNGTPPYTTFNVSGFTAGTTGLTAANLTTDASAGTVVLSGTPSAAGTASFTVNVADSGGATLTKTYTLTVNPALSITPAALAGATAGRPTNQTITVSNGTKPYTTFSISGFSAGTTGLTAGNLTTNAVAGMVVLSGTPSAAGTASFTVNVTDTPGATLTKSYTLTVNPVPSIAPAALAAAVAGTATNQTITVSDGTKPYTTFSITGFSAGTTGLTAANLTTDATAGTVVLSGTPSAAGTATFTVNVVDTPGATLTKSYSLTVNPALTITPAALAEATAGTATDQTITVSAGTPPYPTFNVSGFSAGTTGLTAASLTTDSTAGTVVMNGTPTAAGTASFTVNVIDSAGSTLTKAYTLTVNPALSIAPAALAAATAGTATNQTITVSNGTRPYSTFNVSGFSAGTTGLTAANLTADITAGTVVLSGTPTAAGTASFTVNVIDAAGATLTKSYSLTVNPALSVAPATLASATAGKATSQTITISNGTTPYTTFSISGFSAGTTGLTAASLTTDATAGTIALSGTPTAAGTATFTVNVTDTAGATLTKAYSLTVNPALSITPATLAGATAGRATNQTITVSNGTTPYTTFNVSAFSAGTTGLTAANLTTDITAGTVVLSGTPTAAGAASFTVNVTDTAGATLTKAYTLTVNPVPSITPAALAAATAGTATSQTITVSNGTKPYTTFSVSGFSAGTTGLTVANLTTDASAGTVVLSGTPTAAGAASFTVNVTDTAGATLTKAYTLTVNPALSIAPAALAKATTGTATNQTITVSNGTTPYTTLSVTGFTPGTAGLTTANLTANPGAGTVVLSGTPTAAGTATFTVNATDTAGATLTKAYTLTVNPALSIAPATLAGATAGRPTSQTITVSNGSTPYTTLSVSGFSGGTTGLIAANLTTTPGAGTVVLSGTPSAAGTASFTVNVTDTAGATLTKAYTLTVNPVPSIAPAALAGATAGTATSQTITVAGGTTPYTTFSVSSFSAGTTGLTAANLTTNVSAQTVVLSGTPTAAGTASFTVNATDTPGATLTKAYTLTVNPLPSIAPAALVNATAGTATSQTITVSGGTKPYTTFNISGFSAGTTGLTAGNLTANSGAGTVVLSGTPTAAGTASFTVNATDTAGGTLTKSYSLTVNPAPSITPAALAGATTGTVTSQTITVSGGTKPYTAMNVSAFSAGTTGLTAANLTTDATAGTVVLSGTPTAAGTASFTVNVTDTPGATLTKSYTLTVNLVPSIAPAALAGATSGTATSQTITVSGGTTPYPTFNVSAFSAGTTGLTTANLTTDAAAGTVVLSGTPSAAGTASFTVNATDTAGASLTKSYSLTVNPELTIAPATLVNATAGTATSQTVTMSGGATPYTTFGISGFSAGTTGLTTADLTTDAAAGTVLLSGTPTAAGTASFTVNATDTAGATLAKSYTLTVNSGLTIAPSALAGATAGRLTSQTITVSDGTTPYTIFNVWGFSAGTTGLTAANLTTDAAAGTVVLSGTPSAAGTASFTVNATDTAGASLTQAYALTVNPVPSIAPATLADAIAVVATNQTITVSDGTKPYATFNVSDFSAGTTGLTAANLTTDAAAGTVVLSGTPAAAGTATFTVNVTDTPGATLTKNYTLTVRHAAAQVRLSVPADPILPGQMLQLRVIVSTGSPPAAAQGGAGAEAAEGGAITAVAPTGSVTVREGTKVLGVLPLTAGQAVFKSNSLTIGKHAISVIYQGSATHAASSSSINVTVDPRVGLEFRVNGVTAHSQQGSSIARLADGGLVIVWQSDLANRSGWDIYAQRYDAAGAPVDPEFRVNSAVLNAQSQPTVAAFSGGGFVVGWTTEELSGLGVRAQRFSATGAKLGEQLTVNTTKPGRQWRPVVATLPGGAFVIVWASDRQDGSRVGVYGRRYDADGLHPSAEFLINTTVVGSQVQPSVTAFTRGGFVVAWTTDRQEISAQRFNSAGTKHGGEFRVNTTRNAVQVYPVVAALRDGGFVITWESANLDGSSLRVLARRYNSAGTPSGVPFLVNTSPVSTQFPPAAVGLAQGGFAIMWSSIIQRSEELDVRGQIFDAAGKRFNVEFPVNITTKKNQWDPSLTAFGKRGFVAAWSSRDQDGSLDGVYGQRLDIVGP